MPYKKLPIGGAHSEILSWANHDFSIEEQSMLRNVSRLPCLFKHVALMPDAHLGKGSMVGSVIATKEAVIPATVGVDIGCGMMAVKTPFKSGILDGKLKDLPSRMPLLNGVFTAIMPQPMSTPTVAGMTASFVAITEPTMLPLPRCASGISATCLNKHGRRETLRSIDCSSILKSWLAHDRISLC